MKAVTIGGRSLVRNNCWHIPETMRGIASQHEMTTSPRTTFFSGEGEGEGPCSSRYGSVSGRRTSVTN